MFKARRRDRRRRSAVLGCAALLVAAISTVHPGSAAALGEQCSGSDIDGRGSVAQLRAQSLWSGTENAFNQTEAETGCAGSQGSGGKPEASYTPVGSGAALHAWGADDGIFHQKGVEFLGTTEPPAGPVGETGTQLQRMKKALGSDLVVAPIAQTAIAVVAHPPRLPGHPGCSVEGIAQGDLAAIFAGLMTNWRQLATASDPTAGGDCDQAITRAVRTDASGETYQFKHFLYELEPETLECTGKTPKTWAQLQSSREPAVVNLDWPRKSDCQEGEGPVTTVVSAFGEGELPVDFVDEFAGTITFAALPEAQQRAPEWITAVYNGVKFAQPQDGGNDANCAAAEYALPSEWAAGVNVDWSQVYGSDPESGKSAELAYPICTLTWAIAAADSGGVFGSKAGTTVRDYLLYAHDKEGGQALLSAFNGYAAMPSPVANASAVALGEIGGEGEEEEGGGSTGTVLCKTFPEPKEGVLACPSGQGFPGGKLSGIVAPESVATFESTTGPKGTISCAQAYYTGEFEEDGTSSPAGGINYLSFGQLEGCASTFPEEPEATLSLENLPYDGSRFVYLSPLAPEGAFVLATAKGGQILLRLEGISVEACVYTPNFLGTQVLSAPPSLDMQGTWKLAEGLEEACPIVIEQSSQLTLTQGGGGEGPAIFVAGE